MTRIIIQKVANGLADEYCDKNSFHSAVKAGLRDATLPVLVLLAMAAAATLAPEKCCDKKKTACKSGKMLIANERRPCQ